MPSARAGHAMARLAGLARRDPWTSAALIGLLGVGAAAIAAPWLAPFDPLAIRPGMRLARPLTGGYLLGGDQLGRDVLSRLLWGGRISLAVAILPMAAAALVGVALGVVGTVYGGRIDGFVMRTMDVLLAFPAILTAIAITASLGPGIRNAMIAVALVSVPAFARIVRSVALSLVQTEFVSAAHALGAGPAHVIRRHVLPNVLATVIVFMSLEAGRLILVAAGLGFLGLGVQPPTPEWGAMLSESRHLVAVAPHLILAPGAAVFLLSLTLNVVGDGLRDALDPKLR